MTSRPTVFNTAVWGGGVETDTALVTAWSDLRKIKHMLQSIIS